MFKQRILNFLNAKLIILDSFIDSNVTICRYLVHKRRRFDRIFAVSKFWHNTSILFDIFDEKLLADQNISGDDI